MWIKFTMNLPDGRQEHLSMADSIISGSIRRRAVPIIIPIPFVNPKVSEESCRALELCFAPSPTGEYFLEFLDMVGGCV